MSKGGSDAPSADPAIGRAAEAQAKTGADWLSFAKDAFAVSNTRQAELDALTKEVTTQQLGVAKFSEENMREDRARYEAKAIPAQDAFAKEASEYGSEAKVEQAAAEARTGIQTEAAAAREQSQRSNAAMGIAPGSGRYAGTARGSELATAGASAGAANAARTSRRDKALALKADVANMYAGLPAQSGAAASTALAAGSSAVGLNQGNQQLYQGSTGIMNAGFGGAISGYGGQAQTMLGQYGIQTDAWKAEQEQRGANAAGLFGAIGSFAGMAAGMSDPKLKTDVKEVDEGEGLKAVKKMPISKYRYKQGVADSGAGEHTGTMADKFAKATGTKDNGMIVLQDAIGITMKAVQDLDAKVDKLGGKGGKAKPKAKAQANPKDRRPSQSPAKARTLVTAQGPQVKALGISRRA